MSRKSKQHDKQSKLDAIQYVKEHPDLTQAECCKNLGIGLSTLSRWQQQYKDNEGDVPTRGSGNYATDEQKNLDRIRIKSAFHAFQFEEIKHKCNYINPIYIPGRGD